MPTSSEQKPVIPQLSLGQAVSRGIRRRCPGCGQGRLFRGWFRMHRSCSHCGFRFERAPGYFLGSTYINYGVTAGITSATYVILRFGYGFRREALLPLLLAFCLLFPLVFFRFARSMWLSLDCYLDRITASEAASLQRPVHSTGEVSNNDD